MNLKFSVTAIRQRHNLFYKCLSPPQNIHGGISMKMLIVFTVFVLSLTSYAKKPLSIMTYNVENLFDHIHDKGKEDWTYLPLEEKNDFVNKQCDRNMNERYRRICRTLDWNESVVMAKIENLSSVISAYNNGQGPDILVLTEIENERVLNWLVDYGLAKLDYQTRVLIEGPDRRGVDVAIISKYPILGSPQYHEVDLPKKSITRGILQVDLQLEEDLSISVLANHWPAQMSPEEYRHIAAGVLKEALEFAAGDIVVAAGDFNSTRNEWKYIARDLLNPEQMDYFIDATSEWFVKNKYGFRGTYSFRGEWRFLDRILLSNDSLGYVSDVKYQLHIPSYILGNGKEGYYPKKFNSRTAEGYSDHLPSVMELMIND